MNKNIFDEQLNKIEMIEKSDSSLDKYLNELNENDNYIDENENFEKIIFNNVMNEIEKEKYKEMNDIVNQNSNVKQNTFVHGLFKFGKIALVTCICYFLTLYISSGKIEFTDYKMSDSKFVLSIEKTFDNTQDFMTMPLHENLSNINNKDDKK